MILYLNEHVFRKKLIHESQIFKSKNQKLPFKNIRIYHTKHKALNNNKKQCQRN